MKFSIITPTYRRPEMLQRAVASVMGQDYTDWEMLIINDSPDDARYIRVKETFTDTRVRYLVNDTNQGVNYSRNRGLDACSAKSDYVIFLDDDDYLAPTALTELMSLCLQYDEEAWIVTNRKALPGATRTRAPRNDTHYRYALDYLMLKRIQGDATHCIKQGVIGSIRFPRLIPQGEEWLFYFELGTKTRLFYHDYDATLTDGYSEEGLNFRRRGIGAQFKVLELLLKEGRARKLLSSPIFLLYFTLRFVRALVKA